MKQKSFVIVGAIAAAVALYLVFRSQNANVQAAGVANALARVAADPVAQSIGAALSQVTPAVAAAAAGAVSS